ncbi:Aldo/keto reductase [Butyriboletus roseoflavus]|nr:Aldo/keto reductase [Butyriboletus roseoflavus]
MDIGTYQMGNDEAYKAVRWALEAGYRHIDSADWYNNEQGCGRAIREFINDNGLQRSDIFYTSKLKSNNGKTNAVKAIDKSLKECGLGYIDLYLIHSPLGGPQMRRESWEAIAEAQKEGKLKSIGISNFGVGHMGELLGKGLPDPAVNQVDLHPFMTRTAIVEYCTRRGILLEAWAPLVEAMRFKHPAITTLAKSYKKEPAQILLRYSLQKGFIPLPKSSHKGRIISNTRIYDFELQKEEVECLDSLNEALVTDWDPTECP